MFISPGDLIDLYNQALQKRQFGSLLNRLFMSKKDRTVSWWNNVPATTPRNWWAVPAVNKRWNNKITGDPELHCIEYVGKKHLSDKKNVRLLSPGCGEGEKECAIATMWPDWHITGFDLNPKRIENARSHAQKLQLSNIDFLVRDIQAEQKAKEAFDIILFDSSLHHFTDFDILLPVISSLLSADGLLVINEYTGPDRFQWTKDQLCAANKALSSIPMKYRTLLNTPKMKRRIYRPGLIRMLLTDPSEAAESSNIIPSLHNYFTTIEETPLGGNILHLLLKDIAHHFMDNNRDAMAVLEKMFAIEDEFIKTRQSDFTFGIYRKKTT